MDLTDKIERKVLTHRRVNPDGSVTVTTKLKRQKRKKIIVAKGKSEHTIGAVMTSQLLPFNKIMRHQLNRNGYDTRKVNFNSLIPLYYNEFVSNKENKNNHFIPINTFEFRNNPLFKIHPSDNLNGELNSIHSNNYVDVNTVVNNIIGIFKVAKLKKRQAILNGMNTKEVLTNEELVQASAAEKIEKDLENKMLNEATVKTGQLKKYLLWAVGILLIWYLLK